MTAKRDIVAKVIDEREVAFTAAIRALAKYKFWMFGYHAASWVKHNRLLKGSPWHQGSPFKRLVELAQIETGELADSTPSERHRAKQLTTTTLKDDECPCCGSGDVNGHSVDTGGNEATQAMHCGECSSEWVNGYGITAQLITEDRSDDVSDFERSMGPNVDPAEYRGNDYGQDDKPDEWVILPNGQQTRRSAMP